MPIPEFFADNYQIATDRDIRSWSFGQVAKPRVPYSSPLADRIGTLDDQRIFGPVVSHRCGCGKYAGAEYDGMICDCCGVKLTTVGARKTRFGHINFHSGTLAHPFDAVSKISCFPVISAFYLESQAGRELGLLYERLVATPDALTHLIEYLMPVAVNSRTWNLQESQIFTRGIGLVHKSAA